MSPILVVIIIILFVVSDCNNCISLTVKDNTTGRRLHKKKRLSHFKFETVWSLFYVGNNECAIVNTVIKECLSCCSTVRDTLIAVDVMNTCRLASSIKCVFLYTFSRLLFLRFILS